MKPVFIINTLSETVAKKGSKLKALSAHASAVFDDNIFDNLDVIVTAGQKAGWVIIEGGDGTAQGIVSAFFNRASHESDMPKFTLLPGGMTNQVAKNIGLKNFSSSGIQALLRNPVKQVQMPLLKVDSKDHPKLYGFLFSTGGVPMITQYTKERLHKRGIGGSAAVVGGILKGLLGQNEAILKATKISLDVDDDVYSGSHLGTLVTTLNSLILGLDPFWGSGSGPLRITYVENGAKHLPAHVAGLWLGRKTKDRRADGLHSSRAQKLKYNYNGPIVLDGEPLTLNKDFIVTATRPLTFIQ